MMRVLLTVPAWNEASVLDDNVRVLHAVCSDLLHKYTWTIEIAENGSSDETRFVSQKLCDELPHLLLHTSDERGKGRAIRQSWLAHREDADTFVFIDADLSPDPRTIPDLIHEIEQGADLVCASRRVRGAHVMRPWTRRCLSRVFDALQMLTLALPVHDVQCGLKAVTERVVRSVLPEIMTRGWLFDSELVARVHHRGWKIRECPVSWTEERTPHRRSALAVWREGWGCIYELWKIRQRIKMNS